MHLFKVTSGAQLKCPGCKTKYILVNEKDDEVFMAGTVDLLCEDCNRTIVIKVERKITVK